ncbi:hypothetical protein BC941DRAFT_398207 [Chlamydoabsidia padenii]|nr:hypothetical protein BC941DRAFT_398207 [Chlamydoabsidia padenii]
MSGGGGSKRKDDGYIFEQQNDVRMNELGSKISALKNITIDIHQDVTEQDRHLNESQGIFDGFGNSLQNSFGRMNRMVSKRHQRQLCLYVTIALGVFFVLYYGSGLISWSSSSSSSEKEVVHDGI